MTFFFTSIFILLVFWRPQEWLVPWLFGWPILDAIVVLAFVALVIENNQGSIRIPSKAPQIPFLVGLWIAAILSNVVHTYFEGMMITIPEVFKICFFTILLFCVLDRTGRLRAVACMFVLMSCIMSVHAIMQQKLGYGFAGLEPMLQTRIGVEEPFLRSYFFGIFGDPNDLAQILATSIPFAFVMTKRRSFFSFVLGCAVTYLLVLGIMATNSRSGLVALAGVVAIMVILILPVRWMPVLMVCMLVGALVIFPLSQKWLDTSAHDRVVFWGEANQIFKSSPLNFIFGIGYGMFVEVSNSRAAHNAFVGCYTELGIIGYWFWFGLIYLGIAGTWRARVALNGANTEDGRWLKRFAGLGIAAIIGFLASGYFLSRTFIYPLFFLIALLGAVPIVAERLLPDDHPPIAKTSKDVWVGGSISSLISIIYIYISIILLNKLYYG